MLHKIFRLALEKVNRMGLPQSIQQNSDGKQYSIQIRIGIHTGPVVGGVIGKSKFQYDIWGSTVNLASRMESTGVPGRIQISRASYERLHDFSDFRFEQRDNVFAKGVGNVVTYLLNDDSINENAFDVSHDIEYEKMKIEKMNSQRENKNDDGGMIAESQGQTETNDQNERADVPNPTED